MKNKTLGSMIQDLRKAHNMTQMELADKMGVTDKAVSKWERDLSCPDINSIPKLAEIFEISVDDLMQVKIAGQNDSKLNIKELSNTIFKALGLAMGVAVLTLSLMNIIDAKTSITLLSIGLTCIAISNFS
ncbi:MAG: helix-turn-helix transcriptional regulator [Erysipelotrichaceae bacterium]|nr:helix-turn-helix transcriptional regulator [Erysipelotrichaceae bacterium]